MMPYTIRPPFANLLELTKAVADPGFYRGYQKDALCGFLGHQFEQA